MIIYDLIFHYPKSKSRCYQELLMTFSPDSSEKEEKDCGQTVATFLIVWLAHFFSKCFFCWSYLHSESNFGIPKWLIYLDYSYIISVLFFGAGSHGFGGWNQPYFIITDFLISTHFSLQNGGSSMGWW